MYLGIDEIRSRTNRSLYNIYLKTADKIPKKQTTKAQRYILDRQWAKKMDQASHQTCVVGSFFI